MGFSDRNTGTRNTELKKDKVPAFWSSLSSVGWRQVNQQAVLEQGTTLFRLGPVLPVQQRLVVEYTRDEIGSKPAERDEALASPFRGPGSLPPFNLLLPPFLSLSPSPLPSSLLPL